MITTGISVDGKLIAEVLKPQGYFSTYNEAYAALLENLKNPYDTSKDITLKQLYEEWYALKEKTEKQGNLNHYRQGYRYLTNIYNMRFRDIKPKVIRAQIENCKEHSSSPKRVKILLNLLFDYAVENEIVEKNYAREMNINVTVDDEQVKHHISFTDEEISTIWQHTDDDVVRMILIQCYSGFRPGELTSLEVANIFLDEGYMVGGSKTDAGKNRKVPIHPQVRTFVEQFYLEAKNKGWKYLFHNSCSNKVRIETYRKAFKAAVDKYQLNPDHKCHDPRKFFVTQAKRFKLDEYAIKLIVGHAIQDITEKVYTERSVEWLCSEMEKIQCTNNVLTAQI